MSDFTDTQQPGVDLDPEWLGGAPGEVLSEGALLSEGAVFAIRDLVAQPPAGQQADAQSRSVLGRLVNCLESFELQQRGLDAARLRLIAAAVDEAVGRVGVPGNAGLYGVECEIAYRALRSELALAFNLGEHQTEGQMRLASELSHSYRASFVALEEGVISATHARVIVDAGQVIGAGRTPELDRRRVGYESEVIEFAARETPNRLRPIARRLAERWAERTIEERHREACDRRRVIVVDCEEGMADLIAHLPAVEAYAIKDRLTRIAQLAERGERVVRESSRGEPGSGEPGVGGWGKAPRTRDQLRADVFAELLLAADENALFAGSAAEAVRARVQLFAHRAPEQPGALGEPWIQGEGAGAPALFERCELVGHGPISAETAAGLAREAPHWQRVETDEASGAVLRVERYRPSEEMRRLLGARDRHCRFPGCRAPLHRCDLDHTIDAAKGGPTATSNLAFLCRGHHTLKHHSGWQVIQREGGVLDWCSPTGRAYRDRPPSMVRFKPTTARPPARDPVGNPGGDPARGPTHTPF